MITALALATIGLLALFDIPGLSSLSSYWLYFELGAFVSFAAGVVCCCRCLCVSLERMPPSENIEPQQEYPETPGPLFDQTNIPSPTQPSIQKTKTAEDFFVLARKCVQGKGKDKKNYQAAKYFYRQAQKLGHIPSIFYLGKCYLLGKGTAKDQAKAVSLFEEAAEEGHVESIYALVLLDMELGKIDQAITRLEKIPDENRPFKNLIDTFLASPRTDNTISILKKALECEAGHIKAKKKMERSITWVYV